MLIWTSIDIQIYKRWEWGELSEIGNYAIRPCFVWLWSVPRSYGIDLGGILEMEVLNKGRTDFILPVVNVMSDIWDVEYFGQISIWLLYSVLICS